MGIERIADAVFNKPIEADLSAKASLKTVREAAEAEDKSRKPGDGPGEIELVPPPPPPQAARAVETNRANSR